MQQKAELLGINFPFKQLQIKAQTAPKAQIHSLMADALSFRAPYFAATAHLPLFSMA